MQYGQAISGTEKGERIAMLLSPATSMPIPAIDSTRQPSGSSFTSFLTAPLQSFILLLGFSGSDVETVRWLLLLQGNIIFNYLLA